MAFVPKECRKVVDPNTGEVLSVIAIVPEVRDRGFAKVYELFSWRVLEDLKQLGGASGLLLMMVAKTTELGVNSDGWFFLEIDEMGELLGVSRATVFNYLKILKEKGYIEQKKSRQTVWRIVPDLVFKGNLTRYREKHSKQVEATTNVQ